MSRILEDHDAKAMILMVALLIGVPLLGAIAMPRHSAAPGAAETVASQNN